MAVDNWLNLPAMLRIALQAGQARKTLFEGVVHRQVVLTVPKQIRPLIMSGEKFLKAYMDAGALAIKELIAEWRIKKKIKVGMMGILQLHGRAGNQNPHLHFVVSEGGIDKNNQWQKVNYFSTKQLRKKWQYHAIKALQKAVKGTAYAAEWRDKLGSMFDKYPTGFDCNCMPEEGPVERLVIYLCKYVSSPPISIRRIEGYDGQNVTYRYKDHRRGEVKETITAVEFIGRMIRHLPPKGFRMVRYYGIYARPVREKIHALVATVLKNLVDCARKVAQYFASKNGKKADEYQKKVDERFGKGDVCCPECGEKMTLIKIWSKKRGVIYDAVEDGSRTSQDLSSQRHDKAAQENNAPGLIEQLSFGFLASLNHVRA